MPASEILPPGQERVLTADLLELLERYEAAQRALCEDLRRRRQAPTETGLLADSGGGPLPTSARNPPAAPLRSRARSRMDLSAALRRALERGVDPVTAESGHKTNGLYAYFPELATDVARSGAGVPTVDGSSEDAVANQKAPKVRDCQLTVNYRPLSQANPDETRAKRADRKCALYWPNPHSPEPRFKAGG